MKYKIIVMLFSLASCNVYSATAIHLSGNKITRYYINIMAAADGVNTYHGPNYFSTKTGTTVRGNTSTVIDSQYGIADISTITFESGLIAKGQMLYGRNAPARSFLFLAGNPTTAPFGQTVWVTFSGPDSDKGLQSRCMTNNTINTYVRIGGVTITCGVANYDSPAVNVEHQSMQVSYANTWSGLYEQNVTLNPGQSMKVLWGTAGNTNAKITSILSGSGMNDVKLSGDCNGSISPSGQCSVVANNHSWFGTRTANLNITISLP
ncbi:TPA: hypothetical protein ACIBFG_004385 [Salmonella enterica subsp. enterica serovar Bahrenfeld]|nr:hypothetical protein [Salmonella enterica]HAR9007096.1 hypothetical protein [Salmonella enterica]HAR9319158.1 hypothetical protein [Salmonella enterica]